jgi:hypothetical protein
LLRSRSDERRVEMRLVKNVVPRMDTHGLGQETEDVHWLDIIHDPSILCKSEEQGLLEL